MLKKMTWDEFCTEFHPIPSRIDMQSAGGISESNGKTETHYMFETYGEDLEFVKNRSNSHPGTVWTYLDDGNGGTMIGDGMHVVNRLGYYVTALPARPGVAYVIDEENTFTRADEIKAEYLASGCQASDVDEAVSRLMDECGELFSDDRAAWSFLMEEKHEETESPEGGYPMKVSLDGGLTWVPAPEGVRIAYENVLIDGENEAGEVQINCTHEGLITDIWSTREEPLDHNIGTESVPIDDIVTRLVEANS